jgi:hypothetical protein
MSKHERLASWVKGKPFTHFCRLPIRGNLQKFRLLRASLKLPLAKIAVGRFLL